jgi:hypothetical protein
MGKELVTMDEKSLAMFVVEAGQEEHLGQEELELPFLRVAQKGTPQVDDDKPEYIEGLKPGCYFNTVSGKNYGDTIKVQVHGYFHNYIIWKGPKGQGEFSGSMTPEEFREFESKNALTRDGGDMVNVVDGEEFRYSDTRNFIVSLPDYEEDGIMIYPMTSTGIKAARKWNTLNNGRRVGGQQVKRYATLWELKTAGFEGKGFSWKQTASIKPLGWVTPALAEYGKAFESFVDSVKKTGVKYSEASTAATAEDSDF